VSRIPARPSNEDQIGTGGALALLVASVPLGIYRGFVISLLWRWFALPLGAPPIGIVHAMGLTWLVSMVASIPPQKSTLTTGGLIFTSLFMTTMALATGAVLAGLMP
jgi:hypothetical protein